MKLYLPAYLEHLARLPVEQQIRAVIRSARFAHLSPNTTGGVGLHHITHESGGSDIVAVTLTSAEALLGVNTLLSNTAGAFIDGPSIVIGVAATTTTWWLAGTCCVGQSGSAGTCHIVSKLWDGTSVEDSGEVSTQGSGGNDIYDIPLCGLVTLTGTATWKISTTCDIGGPISAQMFAATPFAGSGNNATNLRAVRLA